MAYEVRTMLDPSMWSFPDLGMILTAQWVRNAYKHSEGNTYIPLNGYIQAYLTLRFCSMLEGHIPFQFRKWEFRNETWGAEKKKRWLSLAAGHVRDSLFFSWGGVEPSCAEKTTCRETVGGIPPFSECEVSFMAVWTLWERWNSI